MSRNVRDARMCLYAREGAMGRRKRAQDQKGPQEKYMCQENRKEQGKIYAGKTSRKGY